MLTDLTEKDTLTFVDSISEDNGVDAWRKLFMFYDPKTSAERMTSKEALQHPNRCKDVTRLPEQIEESKAAAWAPSTRGKTIPGISEST